MVEGSAAQRIARSFEFAPTPLRHVSEAFGRSVAIVLGVNAYDPRIPSLRTAVPDAEAIGAALGSEQRFQTIVRRDAEVTGPRVRALLKDELRAQIGGELVADDRLLVYFAGHGVSLPSRRGPEGYLLLADADPDDRRSFFAMSELSALLRALPCRHVMLILDCCCAGTFRWADRGRRGELCTPAYRETLDRFVRHRAHQVLVSASHDQTAADVGPTGPSGDAYDAGDSLEADLARLGTARDETARHSPFAAALLRGLRGKADLIKDNLIVASELALLVRHEVERWTSAQTPQLYDRDERDRGEFVFQVPRTELALAPAPRLSPDEGPYPGLAPYTAAQRDVFCGRDRVVDALRARVQEAPVTALVGPSGDGKSSLLAAGLVPALRELPGWTVLELPRGADLAFHLRTLAPPHGAGDVVEPSLFLRVSGWLAANPAGVLCLVLDNLDELFATAPAAHVQPMLHDLACALSVFSDRLRVVLAVRAELWPQLAMSPLAAWLEGAVFELPPPTQDGLREIIERPARLHELSFDPPSLVDVLINEVLTERGALPLLALTLNQLYVACALRNRDRTLTMRDYQAMGGLRRALTRRATFVMEHLIALDPAHAATARQVFPRMLPDEPSQPYRRVPREELVFRSQAENARVGELLAAFASIRLIVLEHDAWAPAHHELVRGWPLLAQWQRELGAPTLALQRDLAAAAQRWRRTRRPDELWHRDPRLPAATTAARAPWSWLNAGEHAFVTASNRRRLRRLATMAAAVLLVILNVLAMWRMYEAGRGAHLPASLRPAPEPQLELPAAEDRTSLELFRR